MNDNQTAEIIVLEETMTEPDQTTVEIVYDRPNEQQQYQVNQQQPQYQGQGQEQQQYQQHQQGQPVQQGQPYQQGQPIYQQAATPQPVIVEIHTLPSMVNGFKFPIEIQCPYCKRDGMTRIQHQFGTWTYGCCFLICLFSACLGLLPFCLQGCQDIVQHCQHCSAIVGETPYEPC